MVCWLRWWRSPLLPEQHFSARTSTHCSTPSASGSALSRCLKQREEGRLFVSFELALCFSRANGNGELHERFRISGRSVPVGAGGGGRRIGSACAAHSELAGADGAGPGAGSAVATAWGR